MQTGSVIRMDKQPGQWEGRVRAEERTRGSACVRGPALPLRDRQCYLLPHSHSLDSKRLV